MSPYSPARPDPEEERADFVGIGDTVDPGAVYAAYGSEDEQADRPWWEYPDAVGPDDEDAEVGDG